MRRLCSLLGMPQHRFASVHVVGTNGKTSVTLMTAALLEGHGVRSGSYTSPHIQGWRERIRIGGEPISEDAFVRALERTEQAAVAADRKAPDDEGPVTQFELLTAAAFVAFAEAGVKVAVIEAGLGGRLDATNVIPSKLAVLTSVGLDHTEWLGDTLEEIAAEKLAVLRDHTELLHGPLPPEVTALVRHEMKRHHASGGQVPVDDGSFQSRNFALARSAALAVLGSLDSGVTEQVFDRFRTPGRLDVISTDPLTIFDAAHNPDGARALAEALPPLVQKRFALLRRRSEQEVVCCLAILAEKDARGIVEALAPACSYFICTEIPPEAIEGSGRPAGESHPASTLVALCRAAGAEAEAVADPLAAWARARELASERGAAALAAGSHYLLAQIWTERPGPSS